MAEYKKEIYPLKNKSKEGVQHYGFYIYVNDVLTIRQWHKPYVQGHVFMDKNEASLEADTMINNFKELNNLPLTPSKDEEIEQLKQRISDLENRLKV